MITEYLLQYGEQEGDKIPGYFTADSNTIYNPITYDTCFHILKNSNGKYIFNSNDSILIETIGFYLPNEFSLKHNKVKVTFESNVQIPYFHNNSIIIPSENFEIKLDLLLSPVSKYFENTFYFDAKLETVDNTENLFAICNNEIYNNTIFYVPIFMKIKHKFNLS